MTQSDGSSHKALCLLGYRCVSFSELSSVVVVPGLLSRTKALNREEKGCYFFIFTICCYHPIKRESLKPSLPTKLVVTVGGAMQKEVGSPSFFLFSLPLCVLLHEVHLDAL